MLDGMPGSLGVCTWVMDPSSMRLSRALHSEISEAYPKVSRLSQEAAHSSGKGDSWAVQTCFDNTCMLAAVLSPRHNFDAV